MCRRYDLTVDISDSGLSRQEHRRPKAGSTSVISAQHTTKIIDGPIEQPFA